MKLEAVCSSETFVNFYQTIRHILKIVAVIVTAVRSPVIRTDYEAVVFGLSDYWMAFKQKSILLFSQKIYGYILYMNKDQNPRTLRRARCKW
jgi:hypothetical protein